MSRIPRPVLAVAALSCAAAVLGGCASAPVASAAPLGKGAVRTSATLAADSPWASSVSIVTSPIPGPTVLVTGGIHGDEPAGAAAAAEIATWGIGRGTLIVAPSCNPPALDAGERLMPGVPEGDGEFKLSDLNRCFPRKNKDGAVSRPLGAVATSLWDLVLERDPQWVIDLHEGFDFNQVNPKSVGSTILTSRIGDCPERAARMLTTLNETIPVKNRKFVLKFSQATGSLANSAATVLGTRTMIVETSRPQELTVRVNQHLTLVRALLDQLGM